MEMIVLDTLGKLYQYRHGIGLWDGLVHRERTKPLPVTELKRECGERR
jgi:hypothetical protein